MGSEPQVRRAAVLGAGVMGAQIAAVLANAGILVDLLDLPTEGDPAAVARRAREALLTSRPPFFFTPEQADLVSPGSFDDLSCLRTADWIIEAVVEEMSVKRDVLSRVEAAAGPSALVSSNTSGLCIADMAEGRAPEFQRRFLGLHFFNPPRKMQLVEMIPGADTDPELVASIRSFVENSLGKGVVVARDTPNFIANRLGVFALMDAIHEMFVAGLDVETVDAVTGRLLGRPQTATLRLSDLIGLDTLVNVAATARSRLPSGERENFTAPELLESMLERGLLGLKSGGGFYRKSETGIELLDLGTLEYGKSGGDLPEEIRQGASRTELIDRLAAVWEGGSVPMQFARAHLCRVLAYAADHAVEMAPDIGEIDNAMKWGLNWELGPFELWDLIGVEKIAGELERQDRELPKLAAALIQGSPGRFYESRATGTHRLSLKLNSQGRTYEPSPSSARFQIDRSATLFENDQGFVARLESDLAALVFSSKMNVLGTEALDLVGWAVGQESIAGLLLIGDGGLFSIGADLRYIADLASRGSWSELEEYVRRFQKAALSLRYAPFPVVAAPVGLALGGGCELCMAADHRVAAVESQIGLVETGVGLVPAGGGCKELVRRQGRRILAGFKTILNGAPSDNARQAQQWHLLDLQDDVIMNRGHHMENAVRRLAGMVEVGYRPPAPDPISVGGTDALQTIEEWMEEQIRAERLSEHDQVIGKGLARVVCGDGGSERSMDEQTILDLERELFLQLCGMAPTRDRIAHMLKTGKRLRN